MMAGMIDTMFDNKVDRRHAGYACTALSDPMKTMMDRHLDTHYGRP